ncbi:hypothetical protein [Mesorhizobium japonicum]|uniref:hypothetical protein n=1 Tax=Mesorhizobium japonicum TaxID=2066070 RepID=UPI003B5A3056
MSFDKLLEADQRHIDSASRSEITKYFSDEFTRNGGSEWLSTNNRYIVDAAEKFRIDFDANPKTVDCRSLISYISASAPTHLIDGWSFYSRAVEALLRGDSGAAIHLAYYTELRAAMSILASEGIGVFKNKHPIITSDKSYEVVNKVIGWDKDSGAYKRNPDTAGTHRIVWPLLAYWSKTHKAADLINSIIKPEGIELSNWLNATKSHTSGLAISEYLFSKWGIDLANLHEDHQNRNIVSYQPSELRITKDPPIDDVLNFVCETWSFLQPSPGGRFLDLEKALLKHAITVSSRSVIDKILIKRELNLSNDITDSYCKFFDDKKIPLILKLSISGSDKSSPSYPMEILARSFLLLFIATSSVKSHFSAAGATEFEFFWKRFLSTRLCYGKAETTEEALILWEDISEIVDTTQAWSKENKLATTLGNWRKDNLLGANQLPGFELAAIWGLAA